MLQIDSKGKIKIIAAAGLVRRYGGHKETTILKNFCSIRLRVGYAKNTTLMADQAPSRAKMTQRP
jgi:hypothetical protein